MQDADKRKTNKQPVTEMASRLPAWRVCCPCCAPHTLETLSYAGASYVNNISNFEKVFNIERLAWLVTGHIWNLQGKVYLAFAAMAAAHLVAVMSASRFAMKRHPRCFQQEHWHSAEMYKTTSKAEESCKHLEFSQVSHGLCSSFFTVTCLWFRHFPLSTFLIAYLNRIIA